MECRFRRLGNDNEKSPPGVLLKRWWIGISTKKTSPYETWKIAMKHRKCSMSHSASHHERKRVEKREGFFLEKSDPTTWFVVSWSLHSPWSFLVIVQELPSPKLIIFLVFFVGFFHSLQGWKLFKNHSFNSSYVSWWNQFAGCDLVRWFSDEVAVLGLVNF